MIVGLIEISEVNDDSVTFTLVPHEGTKGIKRKVKKSLSDTSWSGDFENALKCIINNKFKLIGEGEAGWVNYGIFSEDGGIISDMNERDCTAEDCIFFYINCIIDPICETEETRSSGTYVDVAIADSECEKYNFF